MKPPRVLRSVLLPLGILAGLSVGPSATQTFAHAAACRSDPKIQLSNYATIDIADSVSDSATDIKHIQYTVHVPAGVTATKITYTSGMAAQESVSIVQDQAAGKYWASSYLTTVSGNNVPVSVYGNFYLTPSAVAVSATVSGRAFQTLSITL